MQLFRTDFDRFEGSLNYATLDLQYRALRNVSIGAGFTYYGARLSSRDSDVNGYLKLRHHGPEVFLTASF